MKKGITVLLAVVIAAGALYGVNRWTRPTINAQAVAEVKPYLSTFFPGASEYKEVANSDKTGLVTHVYEAVGEGFAYKVSSQGYHDVITYMIGINNSGKIVGLTYLALNDTQGIGSQVGESKFIDTIVNKSSTDNFNTISGATVSSTAVLKGIDAAKALFNAQAGIIDDGSSKPEEIDNGVVIMDETEVGTVDPAESSVSGSIYTVVVRANGYGQKNHGEMPNKFTIVIDKAAGTIQSVEVTVFNDTEEVGDKIEQPKFLDQFKGLAITDPGLKVDVATGATVSSHSAIAAVKAAITYVKGQ